MELETAQAIAKAMNQAGFHAAAENFVQDRARSYNEWQVKRLEKVWLS